MKIKVGIVGVSGYTGLELVKILINHPIFELKLLCAAARHPNIASLHPALKNSMQMPIIAENIEKIAQQY